jgi:hypothetical protein
VAVSQAIVAGGGSCDSPAGQALAQAFSQAVASSQGQAFAQSLASAVATPARKVRSCYQPRQLSAASAIIGYALLPMLCLCCSCCSGSRAAVISQAVPADPSGTQWATLLKLMACMFVVPCSACPSARVPSLSSPRQPHPLPPRSPQAPPQAWRRTPSSCRKT